MAIVNYLDKLEAIAATRYPITRENCASERRTMLYLRKCYVDKMKKKLKSDTGIIIPV